MDALDQRMADYLAFLQQVEAMERAYESARDVQELKDGVRMLSRDRRSHPYGDHMLHWADSLMEAGDIAGGGACLLALERYFPHFNNQVIFRLRMAQYHMEMGEEEAARTSLITLCKAIRNYEEAIEVNGLTALWEKYRHLVQGLVEPSIRVMTNRLKAPGECDMQIADILALPDEDILTELSNHLQELTGNGEVIQALNKWERTAYYVDELCMEVNSGGFEGYLYYHGTHFEKAYKALEQMGATEMTALLDRVRAKFPRGRIPKATDSIQNTMDRMEEKGVDFEAEDDCYYGSAERELLTKLTVYVRENGKHFR